jgi:hypothetical protein
VDVKNSTKRAYGKLKLTQGISVFAALPTIRTWVRQYNTPPTLDNLNQQWGCLVYERKGVAGRFTAAARDWATLVVNGKTVGDYTVKSPVINVSVSGDVALVVQEISRTSVGDCFADHKGMWDAKLDGAALKDWQVSDLPLNSWNYAVPWSNTLPEQVPAFYRARLNIDAVADTFLDTTGLSHGLVFVNGHSISVYWTIDPQITLYIRAQQL